MFSLTESPLKLDSTNVAQGGRIGGTGVVTTGAFFSGAGAPAPEIETVSPSTFFGKEQSVKASSGVLILGAGALLLLFVAARKGKI